MVLTLKQARMMREMSQEKMAEVLQIHRNTYAALEENPGRVSIDQAKIISDTLKISVDDIFFGE